MRGRPRSPQRAGHAIGVLDLGLGGADVRGRTIDHRIDAVEPEDALLTRPALEVEARRLPPGGATFLTRLITGEALGAAASAALSDSPSFDPAANIGGLLEAGAFATALCGES